MTPARDLSPVAVVVAIFLLNSLNPFFGPARYSVMPQVVGRDLLATAAGLFKTVQQGANFLGAAWAVAGDAFSFLVAALAVLAVPLPARTIAPAARKERPPVWREVADGWRAIAGRPVVRAMVWLNLLVNVPSFLGPLYPALVSQRLHGGAAAYGTLEAVGVVGTVAGGALAGMLERRLGAGRLLVFGWALAGACVLGMAGSTALPVTAALVLVQGFVLTVGGVSMGALTQVLIPEHYRGRVAGITRGLGVVTIPAVALLAGWLADQLGPAPRFAIGGTWILGVAALAWSNRHVRTARI
jgi:MFS transporter, DHA3 family, macrolide efflux protein